MKTTYIPNTLEHQMSLTEWDNLIASLESPQSKKTKTTRKARKELKKLNKLLSQLLK